MKINLRNLTDRSHLRIRNSSRINLRNLTDRSKKSVFIRELKIGGRRESQICVTLFKDRTGLLNLCSSVQSVGQC